MSFWKAELNDGEASKHHVGKLRETCWLGKMGTQSDCWAMAADDTGKRTRGGPAAQHQLGQHHATLLWAASADCDTTNARDIRKHTENIGFLVLIQDSWDLLIPLPYYLALLLPRGMVVKMWCLSLWQTLLMPICWCQLNSIDWSDFT